MSSAYDRVLDALHDHDCAPRPVGRTVLAICPAHGDTAPSLSINEGQDGRALVHCFGGCSTELVVEALGLSMSDLFVQRRGKGWRR